MAKWCAGAFVGLVLGWILAHQEVAAECSRLNAFYVGNSDFICLKLTPRQEQKSGWIQGKHQG